MPSKLLVRCGHFCSKIAGFSKVVVKVDCFKYMEIVLAALDMLSLLAIDRRSSRLVGLVVS